MTLQWSEDFETGIEEIDLHHESIVEKLNELLTAFESGDEISTIRRRIILFESFLTSHFVLEEVLQKKFAYPDYPSHYAQHVQLSKDFSDATRPVEKEGVSSHVLMDVKDFIVVWWKSYIIHLNNADRQLAEFLKKSW